jgi:zinc transporter ZupT
MKLLLYYLTLLIFIAVVAGYLISEGGGQSMAMQQMVGVSAGLILYVVAMSLVGEGHSQDERELLHKYMANRSAMIAGTVVFAVGIIYQMFISKQVDYWLVFGLVSINLTKIVTLIFLNYRR